MNIDICWYGGLSGLVIAMTMRNDAYRACEENHLSPLITHSSPSRTAVVVNTFGSAPPCGSVIEKHETMSLSSNGLRKRSFCSGVP